MALAFTNLTNSGSVAQTGTTASVAFANNTLYIISLGAHSSSGAIAFVTPVGGGITWTQVAMSNSAINRLAIYCGYVASGASTGTVALDTGAANTNRFRWSIESVTGSAATAANNGSDAFGTAGYEQQTATQTSSSVTLGAFSDATNNVAFGVVGINLNGAVTPEASYSTLATFTGTNLSFLVEYILGQDLAVTSTFSSATVVATAVEVKMLVAAGSTEEFFPVVVGA